jgi:alkanesulfonate monooxygenase SsuD/methylene tetrahydromethanopterin reductase-like flavin-dependent oxidoreductase (luciferase family)
VPRTVEVIETCRQSWGDGLVERLGVSVTPKPLRAGGPPIWLGGYVEPSIRRAAAIGDGWLGGGWSDEEFAEAMGWLRSELAARGRTDFQVGSWWTVFTWDGPDAWERVRPHLHYANWKYEDAEKAKGRLGPLPMPPELSPEAEEELRSTIICGTPDEVAERIERLRNIGGDDLHFVGRQYFPGMDRGTMRRSMRLFGREVIPRFR